MQSTLADLHENRSALEQALENLGLREHRRTAERFARLPEVLKSLTADQIESRLLTAQATIGTPDLPEWRLRPRVKGGGKRYTVLNSEGRSVIATDSKFVAESMADNFPGRSVIDMTQIPDRYRRKALSNALRTNPGNTRGQMPVIPLKHDPAPSKPYDPEARIIALASEVRREVMAMDMDPERKRKLLPVAIHWAITRGWEVASELLFEVKLTLYTSVLDQQTQQIEHFDTAEEAGEYSTLMNQSPDGMLTNDKGKSLGRYRYRVINPLTYQARLDRAESEQES